jgi:hypothetical protein
MKDMKQRFTFFAVITLLFSSININAAYEDDFQSRADILYTRAASLSESNLSWAPEHVMAKIVAHYELGETATADDLIQNGSGSQPYPQKEPFHFTFYSTIKVLMQYPNAAGVLASKEEYLQGVWNRTDGYNIWTGEGTENHVNMSRTSGYLYAVMARDSFPGQFTNPSPSAMIDSMEMWIRNRSKLLLNVGSGEWNSSQYGAFNIIPWLNLYDFATDSEIKNMAKAVCDFYACELALHYSWGMTGGSETRRSGGWESTSTQTDILAWLWYGDSPESSAGFFDNNKEGTQAVYAASSSYRPPEVARKLATKDLSKPAFYNNSKASYWGDDKSLSKQNFYIGKTYTLGAGYLPFGGWSGADFAYCTWKLVSEAPTANSSEWVTGNGMYCTYKQTSGTKIDPFTQVAQHNNTLIQLTKVPESTTKSAIESAIDSKFAQWKTDWQTDFSLRFPGDSKPNPVDDGVKGYRNAANECYVKYIGTASNTATNNNIFFIELEESYIAVRSVAQTAPSAPSADGSDFFVTDNNNLGSICGLIVEVGSSVDYASFSDFQTAIVNNTSLIVDLGSDNVSYTNLDGDVIDMTYNDMGTTRTTLFDWGYGATNPGGYVFYTSPPFIQPTWPSGQGYGRLANWSVNGDAVDLSSEWPVYDGPHLYIGNGKLQLNDSAGLCYNIDYSGSTPVFGTNCNVQTDNGDVVQANNQIKIHPNPSNGQFSVKVENEQITGIRVFDLKGQLIYNVATITEGEADINLNNTQSGVYLINLETASQMYSGKVIVK